MTFDIKDKSKAPELGGVDEKTLVAWSPMGDQLRMSSTAQFSGFDKSHKPEDFAAIRATAKELWPDAADWDGGSMTAGLRPMTPDGPPIIGKGKKHTNLFYNTGHGHMGWTMSSGSSAAIVDIIAGRKPEIDMEPFVVRSYRKQLVMKTALVTGGAKGIGLAISRELVALGWNVVITGRDSAAITSAVASLDSGPGKAIGKVMDVRDRNSIDSVIGEIRNEFSSLDSLINCAGVIIRDESEVLSEADWNTVIDTDLSGVFKCSQAAFADLEKSSGATIVNVGSIAGSVGIAGRAGYTAAKAGLEGLTRTLGLEWASRDIRVNAVAPGWTRTEMVAGGIKDGRLSEAALTARIPQQRLAEPSEIAKVVLFLMSSDSSYITGQTITVDGGITINGNT